MALAASTAAGGKEEHLEEIWTLQCSIWWHHPKDASRDRDLMLQQDDAVVALLPGTGSQIVPSIPSTTS